MAKIFDTSFLDEAMMKTLSGDQASWIYNGLDCCVTAEIYTELKTQLDEEDPRVKDTHRVALEKLAPYNEMSLRGVRIDPHVQQQVIKEFETTLAALNDKFQKLMREIFKCEVNYNSPLQVKNLFYGMMGLKEIRKRNSKGVFAPTVNEDALERLKVYLHARPFVSFILRMRSLRKSIGFLKTELDKDGRIRTSYNTAGTDTGRLSSAMFDFGTGTNLQNVDRSLRTPFVPDPGYIFVNIDLEQADSRNMGARIWSIFHNYDERDIAKLLGEKSWQGPVGPEFAGGYLNACESGDLHTMVCKMTWDHLDWPEDPALWKSFCDSVILHGQDSYRQGAKRLGHGTNYLGKPPTMAKHTHAPVTLILAFQHSYFGAFPGIPAWHAWVIKEIQTHGTLYNLFGRRRMFFGRGKDAATHRKAVAFDPQSSTGEEIDRGILQVWNKYDPRQVQLLLQVHDSILLQVPVNEHQDLIPELLTDLQVDLELPGERMFHVPLEAKLGWNWGDYDKNINPYGLQKWKGVPESRPRPVRRTRLRDHL